MKTDRAVTASLKNPESTVAARLFPLLTVSFLGAANDNILKQILILMVAVGGLWSNYLGSGTQGLVSLALSLPFIFLSGFAGLVTDKYSKQRVICWVKAAEIPISLLALLGLWCGSFWISLLSLVLLAIQSVFFGPAKYGILPDLVASRDLHLANGYANAITNVAVIVGSIVAGPLADMYHPVPIQSVPAVTQSGQQAAPTTPPASSRSLSFASEIVGNARASANTLTTESDTARSLRRLLCGLPLLVVSFLGWLASLRLPHGHSADPNGRLRFQIWEPHRRVLRAASPPLKQTLFCWSGFYFVAAFALLILPEYRAILGVSNTVVGYLTGTLAIAIVLGSLVVGKLAGSTSGQRYTATGAVGMVAAFTVMGSIPITLVTLACLTCVVGFSAGMFVVPLQSRLQQLAPVGSRGQFFGTANALSFVCISAAGVAYYAFRVVGFPPERMPFICAAATAMGLWSVLRETAYERCLRTSPGT